MGINELQAGGKYTNGGTSGEEEDRELLQMVVSQLEQHLLAKFPAMKDDIAEVKEVAENAMREEYGNVLGLKAKESLGYKVGETALGFDQMGRVILEASRNVMFMTSGGTVDQKKVYWEAFGFLRDQGDDLAEKAMEMFKADNPAKMEW